MPEILITRPRVRARVVFLAVWAVVVLAVLLASHEILLPFILAMVAAYVLMPAVLRVERWGIPRWSAVIVVYVLTLGSIYGALAAMAPRLGTEMRGLFRELPAMAAKLRDEQLPQLRQTIANLTGVVAVAPEDVKITPPPAPLRISPHEDGSFEVTFGHGLDIHQISDGRWRLEPTPAVQAGPFEPGKFVSDTISRSVAYVQRNTMEVIRLGRSIVTAISRAVFIFFMTLMLGAYMMITREHIFGFFRSLVEPHARRSFDSLLERIDRALSGVVRGQIVICGVNGVLSAIGFWLFHLKYWPILAILASVMSLVPIFGSILSSIPIVAIALTQSFGVAVEVLLWIVGIHQLEANFLNPKIIGDQAHIHPVLVVFSLLCGEHFFGISGALLAVPVMAIAQSLFLHFRYIVFGDDAPRDSFVPSSAVYTAPSPSSPAPAVPEGH
jgi:predicted PurR-regulated permease PerM